ncbi:hypothetical protein PV08_08360 [Exophiala spinifera]|uniref:N-acetyltransferase domain-containing protein n=1 Tax=Exophiala spinifera TaxID=91928 RepID=A0A0D2B2M0_9EURO|nr:uncharacterized protein PV08_08360 [Exophiala spinifera]KIW13173.1 hypothetical protein PV08_08360 [Exophiala spinifera]
MAGANLLLRVFDPKDLHDQPLLLSRLMVMLNDAYSEIDAPDSFPRVSTPDALWEEFGPDGICAIIQDSANDDIPVAIAGAKRWHKQALGDGIDEPRNEWEVSAVASQNDLRYRRRGLVDRCLNVLRERLLQKFPRQCVCLWVRAESGIRVDYWRKKGFVVVGEPWTIPVGEWHRDLSFTGVTMRKTISRSTSDAAPLESSFG